MKGLGYQPDVEDKRDRLFGVTADSNDASDLTTFIAGPRLNQGRTNSCVAQSLALAFAIRACIQGKCWELFSRLYVYFYARVLLRGFGVDDEGNLLDEGCRPRDALKVLRLKGAPPEESWPFDPDLLLNRRPPLDRERDAIDLEFRYERCRSVGEINHALAQGFPVILGMVIDEAFTKNDGPHLITEISGPRIGGHMATLAGNSPALQACRYVNSWGSRWRVEGMAWLSHGVIADQLKDNDAWAIL